MNVIGQNGNEGTHYEQQKTSYEKFTKNTKRMGYIFIHGFLIILFGAGIILNSKSHS
jgi:hypothetical protein